jgi:hypothetical protein
MWVFFYFEHFAFFHPRHTTSMSAKTKCPSPAVLPFAGKKTPAAPVSPVPWTLAERLRRIEAMGQRINGYIQFMCQAGSLNSISAEAKDSAISAFYARMVQVERDLGRIHDEFKLT